MTSLEANQLLRQMLDDLSGQPAEYQPTSFWQAASEPLCKELAGPGFENFRSLPTSLVFFAPTHGVPGNSFAEADLPAVLNALPRRGERDKRHLYLEQSLSGELNAYADYRVLQASEHHAAQGPDLLSVSESTIGNPKEHFEFDGRRYSRSLLNYLLGLACLKRFLGNERIGTVLEIGGGYGTLGEIFLQLNEHGRYIDIDITPTAAVSSYYLANLFPGQFSSYDETRKLEEIPIDSLRAATVLCPWQLPKLRGKIDLFVNYISFQEMEPDVVKNYLAEVRRLGAKWVLLRNILEGKPKRTESNPVGVEVPILGGDYDAFLPGYTRVYAGTCPFGYRTVDGFHSEIRIYQRDE